MNNPYRNLRFFLVLAGLQCLWVAQVTAQTAGSDQPAFITGLVNTTELTQERVNAMRSDGLGWGNIMITARLAERVAADNSDNINNELKFNNALNLVLQERAGGKGFGQIANEQDLKLGRSVSNNGTPDSSNPPPFINELMVRNRLTQEQMVQLRNSGMGWGEIMVIARLAERIAADNSDNQLTDQQKFDAAMSQVNSERTAGKGYGQIANENDLKLGALLEMQIVAPMQV